jgi:uncharacterized protein YjiS (DUF1127 family)
MANAGLESARPGPLGLGKYIHRIAGELRLRAEYRAAYRRTLAELESMSDRELTDFGFHRSELPEIARKAVHSR